MERKEFCDKLYELRKGSGVKLKSICFAMDSSGNAIYRIETAAHNFSMSNVVPYLTAVNIQMALTKGKELFVINEYENIVKWLKKSRKPDFTQRSLAERVGCYHVTIANTESGKSVISIDLFLQLADVLGFFIELSPKKINEQLHTNKK